MAHGHSPSIGRESGEIEFHTDPVRNRNVQRARRGGGREGISSRKDSALWIGSSFWPIGERHGCKAGPCGRPRPPAERNRHGYAIYDALCGSGITAKMAARGGASMVTTHSLAYFRMQGLSSMAGYLPICDANALTLELGERALINVVRECPLVAGLLCVDPTRDMRRFLEKVAAAGYDGVMNCPTVALIDGKFRSDLEETGMGFAREVAVLEMASGMGLFAKAFCTSVDEALAMAEVGVDNIIVHFGNSSGGTIGSKTVLSRDAALDQAAAIIDALAAKFSRPDCDLSWWGDRNSGRL